MLRAGSIDICQPLARAHDVDYVPNYFYFGPGFLASLHLAAAFAFDFFGDLQASPYHDAVRARQGRLSVPPGPGLGLDPDMEVLNRYRLGAPGRDRADRLLSQRATDRVGSRVRGRCQLWSNLLSGSWRAL